jgi:hypothetical protein
MEKNKEKRTIQGRNGGTLMVGGTGAGGRPKKLPEIEQVMATLLSEEKGGRTAIDAIISSMIAKAVKGDVQAAKMLLDRGYGIPKQQIEHSGLPTNPSHFMPSTIEVTISGNIKGGEASDDKPQAKKAK